MKPRSALALAAAGLAIGAVATASGPALGNHHKGTGGTTQEFTLVEINNTFKNLDLAKGPVGDEFLFTSTLYFNQTQTKDRVKVGGDAVVCTRVTAKANHCVGTFTVQGSQITAQGVVLDNKDEFTIAVTGGTYVFEGVSGQATIANLTNNKSKVHFELTESVRPS